MGIKVNIIEKIKERVGGRYDEGEYPTLLAQEERFRAQRPFEGRKILDCTPVFWNTLLKYVPLIAGGAELTVSISERIPHDSEVVQFLEEIGIAVLRGAASSDARFDIVLDCDGSRAEVAAKVGVCELTRSGVYHYAKSELPVVLVDDSRVKEIETTLGTGDGFMRAMKKFGYGEWEVRSVVIFGFGKVGRGVAYQCLEEGARVTVVDRKDAGLPFARFPRIKALDCNDIEGIRAAVASCDYLITATGVKGAMKMYGMGPLIYARKEMVVAAIGIEDEWMGEIERGRIVNNGEAVNFSLDEPTLLRYIDPTMALSNETAAELLAGVYDKAGINRPSAEAERKCLEPIVLEKSKIPLDFLSGESV